MKKKEKTSRFLSYVLRHHPESIGLSLDSEGWVRVDHLLQALAQAGRPLSPVQLKAEVQKNDKKRFALSADGLWIRANQGHSVEVDLALSAITPPDTLYHGTVTRFLDSILVQGLVRGERHHVHLSGDLKTARSVGARRGKPAILKVRARAMADQGALFYRSANGVWLTEEVPPEFLKVLPDHYGLAAPGDKPTEQT